MALSTTQQLILDKAKEGYSLLILGQSGTGKSHLVKEIARELLRDRKFVSTVRIEFFFLKTLNYFRIKVLQVPQHSVIPCNNCYLFFIRSIFISIKTFCP